MQESMLKQFFSQGHICIKNLFNTNEIQKIKISCDSIEKIAATIEETQLINGTQFVVKQNQLLRAVWAGACEDYLLKIGADKRLLSPVSQILKSNQMDHLINQLHFKKPGDQVEFSWHQDSEHRRYGSDLWEDINGMGSFVQTVMAIDPMTDHNGPLMIFKESAQSGHLDLKNNKNLFEKIQEKNATIINMNPGDVLFFGPYLIHGSKGNNSQSSRRVLINGYAHPGANSRVYPGTGSGRKLVYKS